MQNGANECAICFETIFEQVPLPCACRVPYCLACWDRALAAAFVDSGNARCPTCRSPVRIDFDPDAAEGRGRLVFSAEQGEDTEESAEVVNRLAEQAAPLMTRLLRRFGETHPRLRAMANDPKSMLDNWSVRQLKDLVRTLGGRLEGCVDKDDIASRALEAGDPKVIVARQCALDDAQSAASSADNGEPVPPRLPCVCGGWLKHMDGRQRSRQLLQSQFPTAAPDQLEQVLDIQIAENSSAVVCEYRSHRKLATSEERGLPSHAPSFAFSYIDDGSPSRLFLCP